MRQDLARSLVECCKKLAAAGLIAGQDGNVTVRSGKGRLMVTPSGLLKADITTDDIVEVDLAGGKLRGHRKPTSELDMHLRVFRLRQDVNAIVHAHPPTATGFGVAGEAFEACILPETIFQVGWVPLVPYGAPGTAQLGDRIEPYIPRHDALLLANHGAITFGRDLEEALIRMESLEHTAKILFTARQLGKVTPLTAEDVKRIEHMKKEGCSGPYPGCPVDPEER